MKKIFTVYPENRVFSENEVNLFYRGAIASGLIDRDPETLRTFEQQVSDLIATGNFHVATTQPDDCVSLDSLGLSGSTEADERAIVDADGDTDTISE